MLRTVIFDKPQKEIEVQNAIEALLLGRGLNKGIDYDRESGKFEFSGKEYKKDIKTGIMVEIPSVAIIAEEIAKECDFFSIGTNDLIQYTVAVERGNEKISNLYSKYHPAVIRLIKSSIDGAHKAGIFCGMCGEAASDELLIPLLVGLGLDEFSMNPNKILNSRKIVNMLDKKECEKLAEEILKLGTTSEVEEKLKEFNKKIV